MKYVGFVVTQGRTPAEAIEEMNRDWPAYAEEMKRRGGLRVGRELNLPEDDVATVRVRGGQTLVTDGPFVETKEFIAGFDLFESANMDEAAERESLSPVARFHPFEIRPLPEAFRLGPKVGAFGESDDSDGLPFLLSVWVDGNAEAVLDDPAVAQESEAWRTELEENGAFVFGGTLGAPDTATTLRMRDGELRLTDGPFLDVADYLAGLEVIRAGDRARALEMAAAHPLARYHAIEVRSFYSDAA